MEDPESQAGTGEWVRVTIPARPGLEELVGELFCRPPFTGMEVLDDSLRSYVHHGHDGPELRAEVERELGRLCGIKPVFETIRSTDDADSWQETFRPFRVGRLCVLAPGVELSLRADDVPLRLRPAGAFGTGRHATTRGALLGLQRYLDAGDRVLDVGCGSGIQAVAAALLGAASVQGFDIDPNSRATATELAELNAVQARCSFQQGDASDRLGGSERWDVVVANLYYDLLQRHGEALVRATRPGGFLVVSGCRLEELDRTRAALSEAGLAVDWEWRRGRWGALGGARLVPTEGLEPSTR